MSAGTRAPIGAAAPWHGGLAGAAGLAALPGGVCAVEGVRAAGVAAGLKPSGAPDLALVDAGALATAAGVQTRNAVRAAPVRVTARHLADGRARAILLNAGSANVCTGPQGLALAERSAAEVAGCLGCEAAEVLVASTGVIGEPIPAEPLLSGIPAAAAALSPTGGSDAADAIRTTDTTVKEAAARVSDGRGRCVVGGLAKGSGMIAPGMATMLAVVTTDAALAPAEAGDLLAAAVEATFNRISVDGCMSTNDAVLLLATGTAAATPSPAALAEGLTAVCGALAEDIVRDGEGAHRLVRLDVGGARSDGEALAVARTVADSALVRTAVAGGDPNWGRVIGAVGAAPALVDPDRVAIAFGDVVVCADGMAAAFDRAEAAAALAGPDVTLAVDLGLGEGAATLLTCDLTHDYVTINAEYTT
ncbi:MAG: bifunctional glutamate N-acetyltransferase/amino-acid acetyltransferase ArgJ [Actinomycetota bacterium]